MKQRTPRSNNTVGDRKTLADYASSGVKNIICSTGRINAYRRAEYQGLLGSRKEATWDRKSKQHNCCRSAVPWRHKVTCPRATGWGSLQ